LTIANHLLPEVRRKLETEVLRRWNAFDNGIKTPKGAQATLLCCRPSTDPTDEAAAVKTQQSTAGAGPGAFAPTCKKDWFDKLLDFAANLLSPF
jgi:hypothetical protein